MADSDFSGLRAAVDRELAPLRRALESKGPPMSTEADIVERPFDNALGWRCDVTGNLVGTDTEMAGAPPCICQGHRAWHRVGTFKKRVSELTAERDAAARDMRERCAKVCDGVASDAADYAAQSLDPTAHYTKQVAKNIAIDIRALPDTPAVIATERDGGPDA